MSSEGDNRIQNLHADNEDAPVETAGDLYAPDTSEGGTGDLSEPAKVTLRAYLRSVTSGNGPQARGESTANSRMPPEEGQSETATLANLFGAVQNDGSRNRMSALEGRDTWVVGQIGDSRSGPTRDPFGGIISTLREKYPLGRYVPATEMQDQLQRPGTLESSLRINLERSREKTNTLDGDPGHQNARTEAAQVAATEYQDLHDAVSHALSYNRFSPTSDSPFVVNGKKKNVGWSIQPTLGSYNPNIPAVEGKAIGTVGRKLSLLQTGHGATEGAGGAILPTRTQLGMGSTKDLLDLHRVDRLIGAARSDIYTMLDDRIEDDVGDNNTYGSVVGTPMRIKGNQTYGALNSFREPFEASLGIFLIVAIQLVVLIVVGFLIEIFLGTWLAAGKRTYDQGGLKGRELALGENKPMDFDAGIGAATMDVIRYIFGYPDHLQHKFGDAFMEGLMGFYGVDPDDIASDPVGVFLDLVESSGFYATVMRLVTQDMFDYPEIGDAFDGKVDVGSAIAKTFTILKRSHTLKFIMTIVKLGDQILIYEDGVARNKTRERLTEGQTGIGMGQQLGAASSGAMLLGSLRLKNLSNRFGGANLGNVVAPSPKQLKAAESEFLRSAMAGTAGIYRHGGSGASEGDPSFIDTETRKTYEKILDATYCPFYFHDLRTNEIVSFSAFLTNLNDSYQTNYEDIMGHGRVEASKIYQSTVRQISVTFKVCATTADDVDAMYLKLNRLVAMCYPQYTAGRAIGAPGKLYRAPYSQMPASSPLIRMRIGDIITTNASQLSLARLHGASGGEEKGPKNQAGKDASLPNPGTIGNPGGSGIEKFVLRGHERLYFAIDDEAHPSSFTMQDYINQVADLGFACEAPITCEIEGTKETNDGLVTYVIKTMKDAAGFPVDPKTLEPAFEMLTGINYGGLDKDMTEGWRKTHNVKRSKPAGSMTGFGVLGFDEGVPKISVPVADVDTGPSGNITALHLRSADDVTKKPNKLGFGEGDLMMDGSGNPLSVVKSFHESGGRGLPGVITSMDLGNFADESTVWGIDKGYRAPRMADVTIAFAVIHDTPPGLDSTGQMTSATYGVGASRVYNKGNF